jgi:hypothetical protein
MAELKEIVRKVVRWYASNGRGLNTRIFPLLDDENQTYGVVDVRRYSPRKYRACSCADVTCAA